MAKQINILIIEDSPDDCEILVRHFQKSGVDFHYLRVETEPSLLQALEQTEWHAVICDYTLPQLTAPEALTLVKSRWSYLPFIVLSGSIGEERAVEAMRAGASDYIMKDNLTRLVPVLQREIRDAARLAEQKRMEVALQKSEENLRQAQKLESIGQMAGGIAHDFNNLLATILIQSEVLLKSPTKNLSCEDVVEHLQKGVEQIKKSAERATSLTRQLLAFSHKQIILPVIVNVNDLISDMQQMLLRVVEKNIAFHLHLASDIANIKIDPGHLEQIVINLVMNSRDALPSGGNITIETFNFELDQLTATSYNVKAGAYIGLKVTDDGTGMTEEVQKNVFEPFFTTKPVGKGTGLGLSTVYGIVKQSEGVVTLASTSGKGTAFTIYLPTTSEALPQVKPAVSNQLQECGSEKILVVEDEDDLRLLLQETLAEFGYVVLTASNGSDALGLLTPDLRLIITDVVMPQMGGPELALKALKINPKLKVIFQSGYTKTSLDQAGLPQDQITFLAKPYKINTLLAEIKKILS